MEGNRVKERPAQGRGGITNDTHAQCSKRPTIRQRQKYAPFSGNIDFRRLNERLKPHLNALIYRLLPNGERRGNELVALNPQRADSHKGSFKVNLINGKWADFATGDKGGDIISLWAYIRGLKPWEAARELLTIIGGHHE